MRYTHKTLEKIEDLASRALGCGSGKIVSADLETARLHVSYLRETMSDKPERSESWERRYVVLFRRIGVQFKEPVARLRVNGLPDRRSITSRINAKKAGRPAGSLNKKTLERLGVLHAAN